MPHEPGRLILSVLGFKDHHGPARAQGRPAAHRHPRPRERRGAHRSPSTRRPFRSACRVPTNTTPTIMRFSYSSMTTPAQLFDYDMRTRERMLLKTQEVPSGHDPDDYVTRRLMAPAARRRTGADLAALPSRHAARRLGALPALRLRLLRHHHPGLLQHQLPVAGRPRLRLCHRPYPRRQGQGLCLVRGRQAREQDEHLHGLHRRGATISSPSATPRTTASSRRAARPAAC